MTKKKSFIAYVIRVDLLKVVLKKFNKTEKVELTVGAWRGASCFPEWSWHVRFIPQKASKN
jgi:hypothetical protein